MLAAGIVRAALLPLPTVGPIELANRVAHHVGSSRPQDAGSTASRPTIVRDDPATALNLARKNRDFDQTIGEMSSEFLATPEAEYRPSSLQPV